MVIATDDLQSDGIKTKADPLPSTFRINGLLMLKADPAQQDFTLGVQYKITVPKLAVGNHKFHFTTRSREKKPDWILDMLTDAENVPYSSEVRFPISLDMSGPNVAGTPPEGNAAPSVSTTLADSLYVGPKAQLATVSSTTEIIALDATKFAQIREVLASIGRLMSSTWARFLTLPNSRVLL